MMNRIQRLLLGGILLAAGVQASLLDVMHDSQVTLHRNDHLTFYIAGLNSPYPAEIQFVLGGLPLGGPVAPIPGTSGVYVRDMLFEGTISSHDGSVSLPLTDANAVRLGLSGGSLLVVPGSRSGGPYQGAVDLLSASIHLSPEQSRALFASGDAAISLRNRGGDISFGYPGTALSNDFSASLISAGGYQSLGARLTGIECVRTPEPATMGLLLVGIGVMLPRVRRMVKS